MWVLEVHLVLCRSSVHTLQALSLFFLIFYWCGRWDKVQGSKETVSGKLNVLAQVLDHPSSLQC